MQEEVALNMYRLWHIQICTNTGKGTVQECDGLYSLILSSDSFYTSVMSGDEC